MDHAIRLIAASGGGLCIVFGIVALFKGLKTEGNVAMMDLTRGNIRAGTAGILLILLGTFSTIILAAQERNVIPETLILPHDTITADATRPRPRSGGSGELSNSSRSTGTPTPVMPSDQHNENIVERLRKLQKEAESGNPSAMKEIGMLYAAGTPNELEKNLAKAFDYFRQASEMHYAPATYLVGECYLEGKGVGKDEAKGLRFIREAAAAKDAQAMNALGAYLARVDPMRSNSSLLEEYAEAFKVLSDSKNMGNLDALSNLGVMYMNGVAPASQGPNYAKGAALFAEGARKGNVPCMLNYARCLEVGAGTKTNILEAGSWSRKAAQDGNQAAMHWLQVHNLDVVNSLDRSR